MHIFLTGGTGFIGSNLIKLALDQKHEITAIKRNAESKPRIVLTKQPKWITKKFSALNKNDFDESEILIHLAAHSANFPYDTLENCLKVNVFDTLKIFNLAYEAGIRKFVMTGSCFEYGKKGEDYEYIPPDCSLFPTQSYPTSKAAASIVLTQWALEKEVSLKILRLFQVYGDGELKTRLWPTLKEKAINGLDFKMTKGAQIRDFIKVQDVGNIIIKEAEDVKNNKILIKNIGSGKPRKLSDFVLEAWKKFDAKGKIEFGYFPYRQNEVMRFVPDTVNEYIVR
mgnify:CR=1 FL=1